MQHDPCTMPATFCPVLRIAEGSISEIPHARSNIGFGPGKASFNWALVRLNPECRTTIGPTNSVCLTSSTRLRRTSRPLFSRFWAVDGYRREAVRHAINNLLLKMFIELEPSLFDPSNLLFDSNVLSKVLAPIFERRPAQCIHRDDSLGDGDYGSRCCCWRC